MLEDKSVLITILSGGIIAVSTFAFCLLISKKRFKELYAPLAIFFALVALIECLAWAQSPSAAQSTGITQMAVQMAILIGAPICLCLAPLIWIYTRNITSANPRGFECSDQKHFYPAALSLTLIVAAFTLPSQAKYRLFYQDWQPSGLHEIIVTVLYLICMAVIIVQTALYMWAIFKRLSAYRIHLKDHFTSTLKLEMHWLGWLCALFTFYWLSDTLYSLSNIGLAHPLYSGLGLHQIVYITDFMLTFLLAFWGLRQRPGFESNFSETDPPHISTSPRSQKGAVYKKSGLKPNKRKIIGDKIDCAMRDHKLYQNPNLSLAILSKFIAEQPNYVSESLNTQIGQSFFDYVNHWRIKDAKSLLEHSDKTILEISYAANFNSRSCFYKAFKRETGQTPTIYRA